MLRICSTCAQFSRPRPDPRRFAFDSRWLHEHALQPSRRHRHGGTCPTRDRMMTTRPVANFIAPQRNCLPAWIQRECTMLSVAQTNRAGVLSRRSRLNRTYSWQFPAKFASGGLVRSLNSFSRADANQLFSVARYSISLPMTSQVQLRPRIPGCRTSFENIGAALCDQISTRQQQHEHLCASMLLFGGSTRQ